MRVSHARRIGTPARGWAWVMTWGRDRAAPFSFSPSFLIGDFFDYGGEFFEPRTSAVCPVGHGLDGMAEDASGISLGHAGGLKPSRHGMPQAVEAKPVAFHAKRDEPL